MTTINNDRLGDYSHQAVVIQIPGEAQTGDVLIVDLLERAEVFRVVGAPVHQPVVPGGSISHDARFVHVPGLCCGVSRRVNHNHYGSAGNGQATMKVTRIRCAFILTHTCQTPVTPASKCSYADRLGLSCNFQLSC